MLSGRGFVGKSELRSLPRCDCHQSDPPCTIATPVADSCAAPQTPMKTVAGRGMSCQVLSSNLYSCAMYIYGTEQSRAATGMYTSHVMLGRCFITDGPARTGQSGSANPTVPVPQGVRRQQEEGVGSSAREIVGELKHSRGWSAPQTPQHRPCTAPGTEHPRRWLHACHGWASATPCSRTPCPSQSLAQPLLHAHAPC